MSLPISWAIELTSSVPLVVVLHQGVQNPLSGLVVFHQDMVVVHRGVQNPLSGYSSPPSRGPESIIGIQ